jgi:hypothetical protein
MRAALAGALLLAGCSGTLPDTVYRHLVLTTTRPDTVEDRAVHDFARRRHADVLRFDDLERDAARLRAELQHAAPAYVTVVLRAEQLHANAAWAFYEVASSIDPDPFADFVYGFVPYDSPATVARWLKSVEIADFRKERTLTSVAVLEGGAESGVARDTLPWAAGLARATIRVKPGDDAFLAANWTEVGAADMLVLDRSIDSIDVAKWRFDSQFVFAALPGSASAGVAWKDGRLVATNPDKALALRLMKAGSPAVIASLEADLPAFARAEMDHAVARQTMAGAAVKHTWDLAVLARPAKASLPRHAEGALAAVGPAEAALARVLLGDPTLRPLQRRASPAASCTNAFEKAEPSGLVVMATYTVEHPTLASAFLDPFHAEGGVMADRVHVRHELAADAADAAADLVSSELDGQPVAARIVAQAFERYEGRAFLHVVVGGAPGALAKKGLAFTLRISRR